MTCCPRCAAADVFDARVARRDLRRFRRRGPDASTRQLLAAVRARPLPREPTLLDIGGGIGAIHHILLDQGFSHAAHVDASEAYLAAAADEAQRRGHAERVQFHLAAFPIQAPALQRSDVVTLDRVVCCDPDYVRMLSAAAGYAARILALSYPRPRRVTRLVLAVVNLMLRLFRRGFRVYVHPPAQMHAVLAAAGMRQAWSGGTWIWAVELFERAA